MKTFEALLITALSVGAVYAQKPQFEVASIKPASREMPAGALRGCSSPFIKLSGNRVEIACATLRGLIAHAFRTAADQVTGPDWLSNGGASQFDIVAAMPSGATQAQAPEMLQALLEDRHSSLDCGASRLRPSGGKRRNESERGVRKRNRSYR